MRSRFPRGGPGLRSTLHSVHQWIGLGLGLLFVVLGLTGSLLVFYLEIDSFLNPSIRAQRPRSGVSLSALVEALRKEEPDRSGAWRLEIPRSETSPITARYYKPAETQHRAFAPLIVTLDPNSLKVTSKRFWGDGLMTWIYDLHYTLLLDRGGRTILGIASVILLLLLASGIWLWWPKASRWNAALRLKANASWVRRIYDLHAVPGAYGFPLLVTLVATGLVLEVPDWFTPVIDRVSPLTRNFDGPFQIGSNERSIDADQAVRIASERFPAAIVRWIETPSAERPVWRVQLWQEGEPGKRFPRTNVWIDVGTGEILAVRDPRWNSAGDTFMDWLHPLHNGEALGLPGRILAFIGGLLPLLAFCTGMQRLIHKIRARRKVARLKASDQGGSSLHRSH